MRSRHTSHAFTRRVASRHATRRCEANYVWLCANIHAKKKRARHEGAHAGLFCHQRLADLQVVSLYVEEILVRAVLQFVGGRFVADDDSARMELQGADGPLLADSAFDGVL